MFDFSNLVSKTAVANQGGAIFSPAKPMEAETISNGRSSKSLMSRGIPKFMGNSNRRDFIQKLFTAGMAYAAALLAGCDKPGGDPEVPGGNKDPRSPAELEAEIKKIIDRVSPGHDDFPSAYRVICEGIEKLMLDKKYDIMNESFVSGTIVKGGLLNRTTGVENLNIRVNSANCRKTKIDKAVTLLGAERGKFHHNIVCDDK